MEPGPGKIQNPTIASKLENHFLEVKDDFDSDNLSSFWHPIAKEQSLVIASGPNSNDKKCLKVTVHPGDKPKIGRSGQGTERAEIGELKENLLPIGIDAWYGLSFLVPSDFPINDNRLVIAQWKELKSGEKKLSPVISIRYQEGEIIGQIINGSEIQKFNYAPVALEEWHRVTVNFNIDENHLGYCKFLLDGKMFGEYSGHIGYDELSAQMHFRMGLYRDQQPYEQTLYFDKFRRGTSQEFCDNI